SRAWVMDRQSCSSFWQRLSSAWTRSPAAAGWLGLRAQPHSPRHTTTTTATILTMADKLSFSFRTVDIRHSPCEVFRSPGGTSGQAAHDSGSMARRQALVQLADSLRLCHPALPRCLATTYFDRSILRTLPAPATSPLFT